MCTVGIELQRCTSAMTSALVQAGARALTICAGVLVFRDAAVGQSLGAIVLYVAAYTAFAARERIDAWCADRSPADEALLLSA
jgi:NAD/NADP transhydrogenase alpha subunit